MNLTTLNSMRQMAISKISTEEERLELLGLLKIVISSYKLYHNLEYLYIPFVAIFIYVTFHPITNLIIIAFALFALFRISAGWMKLRIKEANDCYDEACHKVLEKALNTNSK